MYNKFGDRSFQNTTSTPVKSPLNSVSINNFGFHYYILNYLIVNFRYNKLQMMKLMSKY